MRIKEDVPSHNLIKGEEYWCVEMTVVRLALDYKISKDWNAPPSKWRTVSFVYQMAITLDNMPYELYDPGAFLIALAKLKLV